MTNNKLLPSDKKWIIIFMQDSQGLLLNLCNFVILFFNSAISSSFMEQMFRQKCRYLKTGNFQRFCVNIIYINRITKKSNYWKTGQFQTPKNAKYNTILSIIFSTILLAFLISPSDSLRSSRQRVGGCSPRLRGADSSP